ncbi:MAG: bifunctional riboflavin kinase/FAD synthetase [Prevotellaceae bacterium]|jgi:riboflavin kinase/FMN adenylyltransferase|nr:bifunctional riboflavin kinase/FAD synthetase [Prevotellaceae bacterium]
MKIIAVDNRTINPESCVATIGFFDGVHLGHQCLLHRLKELSHSRHLKSAVVTFGQHPRHILHKTNFPPLLTTFSEKTALIEQAGIDFCFVLDFDKALADLSAEVFLDKILKKQLAVADLLLGYDHRFGHNRRDTFDDYVRYGQQSDVNIIRATVYDENGRLPVSSSGIRFALMEGDIESANKMLSYKYSLNGKVIYGHKIGRTIGFPTANIAPENNLKLIPQKGVYAVSASIDDKKYRAMMNIGRRPTLNNGTTVSLEVHIIDFDGLIYDLEMRISFVGKMRDEVKFGCVDELILQLKNDKKKVREMPEALFY